MDERRDNLGDDDPTRAAPGSPEPETQAPETDAAFHRWIGHHLGRLYDPVFRDPLPEDLLRVLDERLR